MTVAMGIIAIACLVIIVLKELVFEPEGTITGNLYKPMNLIILGLTSLFVFLLMISIIDILLKN